MGVLVLHKNVSRRFGRNGTGLTQRFKVCLSKLGRPYGDQVDQADLQPQTVCEVTGGDPHREVEDQTVYVVEACIRSKVAAETTKTSQRRQMTSLTG